LCLQAALLVWASTTGCASDVDSENTDLAAEDGQIASSELDEKGMTAAPAAPVRRVEVTARDFRFTPNRLFAEPGETLIVSLRNAGTHPHSIAFELPGGTQGLRRPLQPGETARVSIKVPRRTGRFVYYCPVADHRARGMQGMLDVSRSPVP